METRPHHYEFAHRLLPRTLLTTQAGRDWIPILASDQGGAFLSHLWHTLGEKLKPEDRLPDQGLAARAVETDDGHLIILLTMPPAEAIPEAHFAAVIVDPKSNGTLRYLTLEYSVDLSTGDHITQLCEWEGSGTHRNYGLGPAADEAAFLDAVRARIRPAATAQA